MGGKTESIPMGWEIMFDIGAGIQNSYFSGNKKRCNEN